MNKLWSNQWACSLLYSYCYGECKTGSYRYMEHMSEEDLSKPLYDILLPSFSHFQVGFTGQTFPSLEIKVFLKWLIKIYTAPSHPILPLISEFLFFVFFSLNFFSMLANCLTLIFPIDKLLLVQISLIGNLERLSYQDHLYYGHQATRPYLNFPLNHFGFLVVTLKIKASPGELSTTVLVSIQVSLKGF